MEAILIVAVIVASLLAALSGRLCPVYQNLLRHAHARLRDAVLYFSLKFYYLTGGDEGMRVLRPYLLGFNLQRFPKCNI
jgi:branched-chain amino acid transport system permease protein